MDINYWWAGLIVLLLIVLVIWLIRRDRKDEKTFENEMIRSEIKPENDKDHGDPDQV